VAAGAVGEIHFCEAVKLMAAGFFETSRWQARQCTPVIPALRRPRQENCKFKASLRYIVRPCHETKQNKTSRKVS
jgi:hypothetical protein